MIKHFAKYLFLCVMLSALGGSALPVYGQQNLIPNGSFEEYYNCPPQNDVGSGEFQNAQGWWYPTNSGFGTSDYFHRCNNSINGIVGVPKNFWGYQEAFHGDGYVGIVLVSFYVNNGEVSGKEMIACKLIEPLIKCRTYKITLLVNLANLSTYGLKNLGFIFSKDSIYFNSLSQIDAMEENSQILQDNFITDTSGWTNLQAYYTAQGNEQFFTLGYFKKNYTGDTIYNAKDIITSEDGCYIYIDSVSLYEVGVDELCNITLPNLFSPNNDGSNDVFDASILAIYNEFRLIIYNRWGSKVAVLDKSNTVWDGYTPGGKPCSEGVYYYTYTATSTENKGISGKGFIQLFR